jgi:4-hydroxybenzoate polyprenyltransferase
VIEESGWFEGNEVRIWVGTWRSLRPDQRAKNLFIFVALVFSRNVFSPGLPGKASLAFSAFCILSGAIYIPNNVCDVTEDRRHPIKRRRPIAAGGLNPGQGLTDTVTKTHELWGEL